MDEPTVVLPPLPKPRIVFGTDEKDGDEAWGFAEDQMTAFARAAVLAERERAARIADDMSYDMGELAAAIRSGKP